MAKLKAEEKMMVPLESLRGWEKNPRDIAPGDALRLKNQLKRLGLYKPLIAVEEDGKYTVLGGNMRLSVLRELAAEGEEQFAQVWISVVDAPDEKAKLEYALSDNDRAGTYDQEALMSLVRGVDDFRVEDYSVDLDPSMLLDILAGLDEAEDVDVDDDRMEVLRVIPPETPSLKERVTVRFDDIESYRKVKKAVEGGVLLQNLYCRFYEVFFDVYGHWWT